MAGAAIQAEIDASQIVFRFNEANLQRLLTGPDAEVARDLTLRAIRVEAAAKENATHRPGPQVRTGRLRGSITWRLGQDSDGLYADVGTAVLYGPYLEYGTSRMPAYPFLRPALDAARG